MEIELHEILVRDVVNGYEDNNENGVVGFGGNLDIRPPFQREFVYNDKQRDAVINTVMNRFPLNVMYWEDKGDGTYNMIDGQQRCLSICKYVNGDYSINSKFFHNLTNAEQEKILNYPLMIYFCKGTDKEKLDWFEVINTYGEKLNDQELRNAIYTGEWLTDAKKHFSKNGCVAFSISEKFLNGTPIRQ